MKASDILKVPAFLQDKQDKPEKKEKKIPYQNELERPESSK